jgi:uncharacterized protein YndB with AHSA1/START domain
MQQASSFENGTFRSYRILPYACELVYEAFERPERLSRWWGPHGFTNTFEIFEFKPSGRWKFIMHGPNGMNYPNENIFVKLDAPRTVVIQHVSQPHFVLTVHLTSHANGTAIEWVQEFEDWEVAAKIREIVGPANEQNLDRLLAVLASS